MGCNQSKQACGCGNHLKDRDGKEYCLPSCQTEVSIEETNREIFKMKTRQRLAQKKGYLKARGANKNGTASLKVYKDQAPLKPTKNFLEIDTVEAIFDRGIALVVNRKEVNSVGKNEEQSGARNDAVKNEIQTEALELCSDVAPKPVGNFPLLLEDKEDEETTMINEEDVKIFIENIIGDALNVVSAERVMHHAGKDDDTTMIDVADKDEDIKSAVPENNFLSSTEEEKVVHKVVAKNFVDDIIEKVQDILANDAATLKEDVIAVKDDDPLITEEEESVSSMEIKDTVKIFLDGVIDKVQEILENKAAALEDDAITVKDDVPLMTEEEESLSSMEIKDTVKIFLDGVMDKVQEILENKAGALEDDAITVKDDVPLMTEEEESVSSMEVEETVKNFLDDVISKVLDSRHLEPEVEATTKEKFSVKDEDSEDNIPLMIKEEETVCIADVDVIKNFVNDVIDNAAYNVEKCSVAMKVEDSLPEPDSEDALVLVHWEEVKTGFDCKISRGPQAKAVREDIAQAIQVLEDQAAIEDEEPLVLVSWKDVKVGVDCKISRGPQTKNSKDEDAQSLEETQVQEDMKNEEPVQDLSSVSCDNVQVRIESVVLRGPPDENIREGEAQIVEDVDDDHKNITNRGLVFEDGRTEEAMPVGKKKDAVAMEQSYAVAVSGKAVSMATAVPKGIDNVITNDNCKLINATTTSTTPFTDIADNERNVLSPDAKAMALCPQQAADDADDGDKESEISVDDISTSKEENDLEQEQQFFEITNEKQRDSNEDDGKISRAVDLDKTELLSRREQENSFYDGLLVPVFFNEPRRECIDLTKRDNSTSLGPKEVLSLLTTVLTPDEILDTAVEVLEYYQDDPEEEQQIAKSPGDKYETVAEGIKYSFDDLEDEQQNDVATNRARDYDIMKADDAVKNGTALDKPKDESMLDYDKERQSSTAEGKSDNEDFSFLNEKDGDLTEREKSKREISQRSKDVLSKITTVMSPSDMVDDGAEILKYYPDVVEEEWQNLNVTSANENGSFIADDAVKNNPFNNNRNDESDLGFAKETQSKTAGRHTGDDFVPVFFSGSGEESIDLTNRDKSLHLGPNDLPSLPSKETSPEEKNNTSFEIFECYSEELEDEQQKFFTSCAKKNAFGNKAEDVAKNSPVDDQKRQEKESNLGFDEFRKRDADDDFIPAVFNEPRQECIDLTNRDKLMAPILFTDVEINPTTSEIIKSKVSTSVVNATDILQDRSSNIDQPYHLMGNFLTLHDSSSEEITLEDNTSKHDDDAVPRSHNNIKQLHRLMEDTSSALEYAKEENSNTKAVYTKQAERKMMSAEDNNSEDGDDAVPRSHNNIKQLHRLMEDTSSALEYAKEENTNTKAVYTKQAKREMMSAEENTSEDDDDAVPRSHSNTKQLHRLMEETLNALEYAKEENTNTKAVYTKQAKREMMSAEENISEDDDDAVPRSHNNIKQLHRLMEDTSSALEYAKEENSNTEAVYIKQAKREMVSADDSTSDDDDDAVPRSHSNTKQLHCLMEDTSSAFEYPKEENSNTEAVYIKQAKREITSADDSTSDDEANAFPRSYWLFSSFSAEELGGRNVNLKEDATFLENVSPSGSNILAPSGLNFPSRKDSGTSRVISKEKLTSKDQETSEKVYRNKELEASINPPPFLSPTSSRKGSWIGRMASRFSLSLSKQNLANAQSITGGNHHIFQQRTGEALKAKVSRWFTGNDRITYSRINTEDKLQDSTSDVNTVQSYRDNDETLYEMGRTQHRNEVDGHRAEYDFEDVMLAMKEFNKVRAILSLDGLVSTGLVTKFLMARDFDVDDATNLYINYLNFRRTYFMAQLNPLYDPLKSELYSGKFTVLDARDQHGAAIAVFTAKLHSTKTGHDVVMYNIYLQLDEAIKSRETQENGIVLLYDFSNISYKTCDVQLCSKILELFKTAYPLQLRKILIVSPPFWFEPEMRLFSSVFRDTKLCQKLHIVTHSSLKQHLPLSSIPQGLGGECHVNHLRLIEECISSYKERAGMNNEDQNESTKYNAGGYDDDVAAHVPSCSLKRNTEREVDEEEETDEEETFLYLDLGRKNLQREAKEDGDEGEQFLPKDLGEGQLKYNNDVDGPYRNIEDIAANVWPGSSMDPQSRQAIEDEGEPFLAIDLGELETFRGRVNVNESTCKP